MAESNNLLVLTFEGKETAGAVYEQIEGMEKEKQLKIADAIIIEYDDVELGGLMPPVEGGSSKGATDRQVRVIQTHGKKGKYTAGGAGIGFLAGMLLGGPIGGLVIGAGIGAITASMRDLGISDKNIEVIKAQLHPNSSALLVLGHVDDKDAFVATLRSYDPKVVSSSLSPEIEKQLRERLAE
jgi:uncharacterized membrane protein